MENTLYITTNATDANIVTITDAHQYCITPSTWPTGGYTWTQPAIFQPAPLVKSKHQCIICGNHPYVSQVAKCIVCGAAVCAANPLCVRWQTIDEISGYVCLHCVTLERL